MTTPLRRDGITASRSEAITPHDSTNIPGGLCDSIYVGTGGTIAVVDSRGTVTSFTNVQTGSELPVRALRINSTGTTASGLVALYL